MARTREEILLETIRLNKLNVDKLKRLVAIHQRNLNEAEAMLKRLNEEKEISTNE
jgi:hypothetical protein